MTDATSQPGPIAALDEEWRHLDELLASLDDADWRARSGCPGWDVRDLVTHIWGTERLLAGDPVPDVDLSEVDTSHVSGDLAELNERWVVYGRTYAPADSLAEFRRVCELRRDQLAAMTERELEAETPSPIGMVPYREFMRVRVFDCAVHELDIRDAVGLEPRFDDSGVWRIVLDTVLSSLPKTVAKKAAAPDGTRVRLTLTDAAASGADAGDHDIVVSGGRASGGPSHGDEEPTVHLTTDTATLIRATGGRTNADPDRIEIAGDAELGRAIVANLAFTI